MLQAKAVHIALLNFPTLRWSLSENKAKEEDIFQIASEYCAKQEIKIY